jgi:hypothetical protein
MRDVVLKKAALHLFFAAVGLTCLAGCNVQVDKSKDGESKNVKIATPFGNIAVNKDQSSAADVGLPMYPGSVANAGNDGNKSAKVDMGFGSFKLRVRVANYTTSDSRDEVVAFYRKALGEYGGVIECADGHPVGSPTKTAEGLTCDHDSHVSTGNTHADLELKAGSERHQHVVSLKREGASSTEFSLIAVDLPHGFDNEEHGTN